MVLSEENRKEYDEWKKKYEDAGGIDPCVHRWLQSKVQTIAAQEAISTRWNHEQSRRIPLVDIATQ